eukprot:9467934-Pyramimonas_sp.AAC.1
MAENGRRTDLGPTVCHVIITGRSNGGAKSIQIHRFHHRNHSQCAGPQIEKAVQNDITHARWVSICWKPLLHARHPRNLGRNARTPTRLRMHHRGALGQPPVELFAINN